MDLVFRAASFLSAFVLAIITGFWAGYISGYHTSGHRVEVIAAKDDPRYRVTPHVLEYYRSLQMDHIPVPPAYNRGEAGKDYCLNLAYWFISIQHELAVGWSRGELREIFEQQLDYEVAHAWMTKKDREKLLGYIAIAPMYGLDRERLGNIARANCMKERDESITEELRI